MILTKDNGNGARWAMSRGITFVRRRSSTKDRSARCRYGKVVRAQEYMDTWAFTEAYQAGS
jgi:hypothetical protein